MFAAPTLHNTISSTKTKMDVSEEDVYKLSEPPVMESISSCPIAACSLRTELSVAIDTALSKCAGKYLIFMSPPLVSENPWLNSCQ